MKTIKLTSGILVASFALLIASSPFSSCKKETKTVTVHDTTTVIHNIHDTTIIVDTFFDLKEGLVASFNFNGSSLADGSGNNNNIVFNNTTAVADRFGKANNAFLFNGSNSYMQVKNAATLNPASITIFAIFKPNGFYNGNCHANAILSKGYPDVINGFYGLRFTDFTSDCLSAVDTSKEYLSGFFGGAGTTLQSQTVHTGSWYNVIFTCDGISSKLYLNGALVSETPGGTAFVGNSHDLFIGKHEDPTFPYYFNGVLDELKIFSRPLSKLEIKNLSSFTE